MENCSASKWTVSQVCDWLISLELPQYKSKFEELSIDGSLLIQITEQDLQNDLQISVRLHRFKIMENLKKLLDDNSEDEIELSEDWSSLILKSIEGQCKNKIFQIFFNGASIGRNSGSNDFVINESFVSRKHCEIRYNEDSNQFLLKDVGSTTGTFIMVSDKQELQIGSMFQMGLSEFKVINIRSTPFGTPITISLVGYEGPARDLEFLIDRQGGKIGRDPENEISVPEDSQLSSKHGQIVFEFNKFYLKDLGSTNKTWRRISAEGESSSEIPIYVGDFIKIGSTVLQVMLGEEIDAEMEPREKEGGIESGVCKNCKVAEPNTLCYPCGHLFCFGCLENCNKCLTCKKVINDKVKVFK